MQVLLSISAASLLFLSQVAFGQQARPRIECNYEGTNPEMNVCAVRDYEAADKKLNLEYKRVMAKLPKAKRALLRSEQQEWLKQRDPKCKDFAKPSEGGSIWTVQYYGCRKDATEQRAKEIRAWSPRK
jgi:uncharacterized protein YecT (DUF1311 family)